MPNEPSPMDKAGNTMGKWLLGTISTITAIVSFVNMMRGNWQLGTLIFVVLLVGNLLLGLLYIIFHTRPASARSKKRVYAYERYRTPAMAGIVVLLIVLGGALAVPANRVFIGMAVMGTPTATPAPTSTPLPPETTMLVTVKEGPACAVDAMGIFYDVKRKDTLDIGINNNSDRDLLITSVTLKPVWITADQWMGETGISATYDVSVEEWWGEAQRLSGLRYSFPDSPTPEPGELERIAKVGWLTWTKPDPLEVEEVAGNKFTVKSKSQDRFQLILGLSETYQFMWGTLVVEITTDANQTLTSDPLDFAVCYEPGPDIDSPAARTVRTAPLNPQANREGMTWFAWNNVATQDSGGVVIDILRVTLAESANGLDFYSEYFSFQTAGEIFFQIQNNTDKRQLVLPSQMDMTIGPASDYMAPYLQSGFGHQLNGYLEPGETIVGSLMFETEAPATEIKSLKMNLGCAFNEFVGCSGPEFAFDVDLSVRANDPLPETIKNLISP